MSVISGVCQYRVAQPSDQHKRHLADPRAIKWHESGWGIEVIHHMRDVTFTEDHSTSRTGHRPINLATIRSAIINAIREAGYLHIPEGRRDHTTAREALRLHGLT